MIVGVLLAAGAGTRFGGDKLLARLPDGARSWRARGAHAAGAASTGPSPWSGRGMSSLAGLLEAEGLDVVFFPDAEDGMGASLAFGVAAAPDADGWIVALADMPFVQRETIEIVAGMLRAGAWIAAPCLSGEERASGRLCPGPLSRADPPRRGPRSPRPPRAATRPGSRPSNRKILVSYWI